MASREDRRRATGDHSEDAESGVEVGEEVLDCYRSARPRRRRYRPVRLGRTEVMSASLPPCPPSFPHRLQTLRHHSSSYITSLSLCSRSPNNDPQTFLRAYNAQLYFISRLSRTPRTLHPPAGTPLMYRYATYIYFYDLHTSSRFDFK